MLLPGAGADPAPNSGAEDGPWDTGACVVGFCGVCCIGVSF